MEGFTVGLALLDFVPVIAFGLAMLFLALKFKSALFIIGAILVLLGGVFKASWKLILGTSKKDVKWMNKMMWPCMGVGFVLMIVGVIVGLKNINWAAVGSAIVGFPAIIFFIIWIVVLVLMTVFKKTKFRKDNAKDNWIAEIMNSIGMISLMIAILVA